MPIYRIQEACKEEGGDAVCNFLLLSWNEHTKNTRACRVSHYRCVILEISYYVRLSRARKHRR